MMNNEYIKNDSFYKTLVNLSVNEPVFMPHFQIENTLPFETPHHHSLSTPYVYINHDDLTEMNNSERLLYEMVEERRVIYKTFGDARNKIIVTSNLDEFMDDELKTLCKRCHIEKQQSRFDIDFDGDVISISTSF